MRRVQLRSSINESVFSPRAFSEQQVISFCAGERFSVDRALALRDDCGKQYLPAGRAGCRAKTKGSTKLIWDFLQRYDDSWIWRCADRHHVTESTRNFAALEECIEDAARHGYVRTSPGTRRKRGDNAASEARGRSTNGTVRTS